MKEEVVRAGPASRVVFRESEAEQEARIAEAYERVKDQLKVTPGQRKALQEAARTAGMRVR